MYVGDVILQYPKMIKHYLHGEPALKSFEKRKVV